MRTHLIALALAAALPLAAQADAPSYSYVDLNYQFGGDIDVGIGAVDTDGFGIKASYEVQDQYFIQFDYTSLGTDPSGIDVTDWTLAAGWHNEMVYARLGWESGELDFCALFAPPCSIDDSGFNVDFGVRTMASDSIELNGHLGYSDLGDLDTYNNFGVGGVFMFSDTMGISFNYDLRSGDGIDFTSYGFGFRATFD